MTIDAIMQIFFKEHHDVHGNITRSMGHLFYVFQPNAHFPPACNFITNNK